MEAKGTLRKRFWSSGEPGEVCGGGERPTELEKAALWKSSVALGEEVELVCFSIRDRRGFAAKWTLRGPVA